MNSLDELRKSIDNLDTALMFLLAERTRLIVKVGIIKNTEGLPFAYTKERESDLKNIFDLASSRSLDINFVQKIFKFIFDHAVNSMKIIDQDKSTMDQNTNLKDLQISIYNLDISLCHILAERFHLANKIGIYKKQHHMKPLASNRWQNLLKDRIELGKQLGVDSEFIKGIFDIIHIESLRIQKDN